MSSMSDLAMQVLSGAGLPTGSSLEATLRDRLQNLARSDARLAPLIERLQERLLAKSDVIEAAPAEESPSPEIATQTIEPPRDAKGIRELKILAERMFAELKVLRARNTMLADALGACSQCWGEEVDCAYCGGDGAIGAYLINPKVFDKVVGPALAQVRQRPPLAQPKNMNEKGEGNHGVR